MKFLNTFALLFVLTVLPVSAELVTDPTTGLRTGTITVNGATYNIRPGANLIGANLSNADLSGANLENARLSDARLISANLSGANLSNCQLYRTGFERADLSEANLYGVRLSSTRFSGADLSGVTSGRITDSGLRSYFPIPWQWRGGYLFGPGANLSGVDFSNVSSLLGSAGLSGLNLTGADLSGANLTGIKLNNSIFTDANLTNVIREDPIISPRIADLETQLAAVIAERDTAIAERDQRPTQELYNERISELTDLETRLAATTAERDTAIAERDERPTVEQMQDARVGSIVVEKDWQSGEVSLSLGLEKTEDGVTWTAYEGGTWTETDGGKFTLSFPLTETKNWVRLALKE